MIKIHLGRHVYGAAAIAFGISPWRGTTLTVGNRSGPSGTFLTARFSYILPLQSNCSEA